MKRILILLAFVSMTIASFAYYSFQSGGIYYYYTSPMSIEVSVVSKGDGSASYSGDVIIPSEVTSEGKRYTVNGIGRDAFSGCTKLSSVTLPKTISYIANGAFSGCSSLTRINITDIAAWCNIEFNNNIGVDLYLNGELITDLEIPQPVSTISYSAFSYKSSIKSVTFSNSVRNIGDNAFDHCTGLKSITFSDNLKTIGMYAFSDCTNLTSITFPNSLESIKMGAFRNCSGLASISIPNSVTTIGAEAFLNCFRLTSVTMPNSITSIDGTAFGYCKSLTSISIPKSVTKIGSYAFSYCENLKDVYCYATKLPETTTASPFAYTDIATATLHVPASSLEKYKSTAPWSEFGDIVALPTLVTNITINGSKTDISKGEKIKLTATVLPDNATDKAISWSSSDPNIVSVNASTGEIIGVGSGTATITAMAKDGSGITGSYEVSVISVENTPRPTSGNYMFVDYVKAKAKQTVQIPVEVVTEEENIVGFQCNIKLPEGMEFVKNAKGNVVFTWNNDRIDGHTITSKIAADGSVKLLAASMNGSTFMETEGVMFYFSATVPEGMEGEQALLLYNVRVSDGDDNEIRCPDMTSVIDVKGYTLGDLNDDGEWSVVDVTMAIKAILDETYIEAGDMNEDGEMSVVDATTIIKYVLNEGPIEKASAPTTKKLKANAIADKVKFVVSPIYVEPGTNNMYLTVDMLNKEEYIGFQTEICLPEGFKFYTNSKGKPTVTLNTDRLETHTATSKLKDERTLRILVASMDSDPILDNEGELLRVRVVADAGVEAGNHTATLIDSRVSDDDDIETKLDVTNGYLRVFGEEPISLLVPEGGYATLCLPYDATLPTGLKAYKATGIKDDTVILEEQSSIAACTPLVIQGTAGTYNFSGNNSGADEFEYSVGSLKSSLVPVENNSGYVLQNLSEGLGFYKIKDALTVPAFRSVLEGAAVNFAPAFVPVGFEEDANAISSVEAAMKNGSAVYTLDGKRVKTMEKGKIYIVGGVKMIVK